jgi:hypothetical protein
MVHAEARVVELTLGLGWGGMPKFPSHSAPASFWKGSMVLLQLSARCRNHRCPRSPMQTLVGSVILILLPSPGCWRTERVCSAPWRTHAFTTNWPRIRCEAQLPLLLVGDCTPRHRFPALACSACPSGYDCLRLAGTMRTGMPPASVFATIVAWLRWVLSRFSKSYALGVRRIVAGDTKGGLVVIVVHVCQHEAHRAGSDSFCCICRACMD